MADERLESDDVDIIVTLQIDPADGLRKLIETHGGKVRGWLRKTFRSLDHLEIDAALNIAHYQLWKFAPDYDESKGTVAGCYLTFARNAAVSILRKEQRHYRKRTDFDAILQGDVPGNEPCDEPPASPQHEKLIADFKASVQNLPPLQRQIIEADLEADGQAGGQWLADKLGRPVNSIYVNRNRAIENLRKMMIEKGHYRD